VQSRILEPRRAGNGGFSGIAPHHFSVARGVAPSRIEPANEFCRGPAAYSELTLLNEVPWIFMRKTSGNQ
jgi:hypothetical protein